MTVAEREVLRLLAAGHTAKSIAAATGRSVAAINERLREARRKTGFGSSRELARALNNQENRDENIRVEPPRISGPVLNPWAGISRGRIIGIGLMTLAFAIAAAVILIGERDLQMLEPAQSVVAEAPSETEDSPRTLRDRFRAEVRDANWAPRAEVALRVAYAGVGLLGSNDQPAIHCAETLCQAAGRSPVRANDAADNALVAALQERSLAPAGLQLVASSFASTKGRAGFGYVAYFRRVTAR